MSIVTGTGTFCGVLRCIILIQSTGKSPFGLHPTDPGALLCARLFRTKKLHLCLVPSVVFLFSVTGRVVPKQLQVENAGLGLVEALGVRKTRFF